MVHHALLHNKHHKTGSQWLVLRNGGADIDSISKNIIGLSYSFYGGLVTASANFWVVLCVNYSLSCHVLLLSSWSHDSLS